MSIPEVDFHHGLLDKEEGGRYRARMRKVYTAIVAAVVAGVVEFVMTEGGCWMDSTSCRCDRCLCVHYSRISAMRLQAKGPPDSSRDSGRPSPASGCSRRCGRSRRCQVMVRGAPGRGSSSNPSTRRVTKRARQRPTIWGETRSFLATVWLSRTRQDNARSTSDLGRGARPMGQRVERLLFGCRQYQRNLRATNHRYLLCPRYDWCHKFIYKTSETGH